jgi:alpha-L-fucosidase 2
VGDRNNGEKFYKKQQKEMKIVTMTKLGLAGLALSIGACGFGEQRRELKLWYDAPARVWEEALPLGNGHIGAMVWGDPAKELYQLNQTTLWSDAPQKADNPLAPAVLPDIRKAIDEGDYARASALWKANSQGPYTARYLPMADLTLKMDFAGAASSYYRDLDISNATSTVSFTADGTNYRRTAFISHPDGVMVVRVEADRKGSVNFGTALSSKLRYEATANGDGEIVLVGKAPKHVAHRPDEPEQIVYADDRSGEGMNFETRLRVVADGGKVSTDGTSITVTGANAATLILSAATSFNGIDRSPGLEGKDPSVQAAADLKAAGSKNYRQLLKAHIADHRRLFDRMELSLAADPLADTLPTNRRLARFATDDSDRGMVELYHQYGRYLMIASSRAGGRPSNLQGMWNPHVQPPWGSNYTTNINTEMNYWPAEPTGLEECHEALLDYIALLAENGRRTAQVNYGMDTGWLAHHNSDVWAQSAPTGGWEKDPRGSPRWSCWPMAGVWFCNHLWQHYLYGGDERWLRDYAWPLMKGSAEFLLQWMQLDPDGYWVTNPASSPENTFYYTDAKGAKTVGEIAKATTMDMAMAWGLFTDCIRASEVLGTDEEFRARLLEVRDAMYPYHVGSQGQLQEWHLDFEDVDPKHRHASHLWGLHPGEEILPRVTPRHAAAVKRSLELRGDGGTGWAMAWKINFWARLEDGDHAYLMLRNGLKHVDVTEVTMRGGGTYSNLFDAHPPFQIDGNFGGTAGITEMLVQCHGGEIFLLPALPSAWPEGSVKGIRVRGGFTVDMEWREGRVTKAVIRSSMGGNCRVRTHNTLTSRDADLTEARGANPNVFYSTAPAKPLVNVSGGEELPFELRQTQVVDFATEKNKTYTLTNLPV